MPSKLQHSARLLLSLSLCCGVCPATARAQQQRPPARDEEEVVRVTTELVQTDVTVFDKEGRFVDNLKREQFELKVDGKPVDISFFERVAAGSVDEDAQLAAARGGGRARTTEAKGGGAVRPLDRGRVVAFFVDDMHLGPASAKTTRDTILRFINEQMGQNDQAVISSASGQIGFLQQLTSDKSVLRRAVELINTRQANVRDFERPPMSENQALAVERRDPQVVGYYVDEIRKENPLIRPDVAENMVAQRANLIITQANAITVNVLSSLESLMRSAAQMPGRKIVFFISDGFFIHSRDSSIRDRMRRISDAAARAGVVVYSMDARGLQSGLADASSDTPFDPTGRLSHIDMSEKHGQQEPLFTLAADTGGRALVNTNALDRSLTTALKETSLYYLLAWRPEGAGQQQRAARFRRIEVSVKGRPDLKVMVRRGFFDAPPAPAEARREKDKDKKTAEKVPDAELFSALRSVFPQSALPTSLSVGYLNSAKHGAVVNVTLEIDETSLDFAPPGNSQNALADVLGAIYNAQGKPVASFKQQISVQPPRPEDGPEPRLITYTQQAALPPGLYQVRVAARDARSGRTGSATEWIDIPDVARGKFAISSIFVGVRGDEEQARSGDAGGEGAPVLVSAGRRFTRKSRLRFLLHIYNAAARAAAPDVALQVQVFRDDQPVVTTPLSKLRAEGWPDLSRIPYAAEINLDNLPAGRYLLRVTAIDRVAKATAAQQTSFTVQ